MALMSVLHVDTDIQRTSSGIANRLLSGMVLDCSNYCRTSRCVWIWILVTLQQTINKEINGESKDFIQAD